MIRLLSFMTLFLCLTGALSSAQAADPSRRTTVSLDGSWDVAESVSPDKLPTTYNHTAPVPGLTHSSTPGFADVDKYTSSQLISALAYQKLAPASEWEKVKGKRGTPGQTRKYFWYRKSFTAPHRAAVAMLKVGKAQFGTLVYLNGVRIGEHWSCFTAGYFDVSRAIRWDRPNELVIRIGAHPGVLPDNVTCGTDFEKNRWTPGIYDSVSLMAMDNPVITTTQVAPKLATSEEPTPSIVVQTNVRNASNKAVTTDLRQQVFTWKSGEVASEPVSMKVQLAAGESRIVEQRVSIPNAKLWSPDNPFLYSVKTSTDGDETKTRFGMRDFHFDTVTQRAYLNGRPFFMRGSNIALHRFFEDPESAELPWTEAWVQKLLVTIPKKLHWNSFRFTIGPVPDRWLEIADENGLLIQNEYAVWVGSPIYTEWKSNYDSKQMISEYSEWMRDGWNHPSVVIWDATNESYLPEFARTVLPAVRHLDLSKRPWENSYNEPGDPNDPLEDHHYFTEALSGSFDATDGGKPFAMSDLEWVDGSLVNPFTKSGHAKILNEYSWMWINRDGSPTQLTKRLYPRLLSPEDDTTENRRKLYARTLGGETELWRAFRRYAGVMHFVYLSTSDPLAFTSDQFLDLKNLTLEPHFEKEMEQAFKPLGVYLNMWESALTPGFVRDYTVYMVNDEYRDRTGVLKLVFTDAKGREVASQERPFTLPQLGAESYTFSMPAPKTAGEYTIRAIAMPKDKPDDSTTSTREVKVREAKGGK